MPEKQNCTFPVQSDFFSTVDGAPPGYLPFEPVREKTNNLGSDQV